MGHELAVAGAGGFEFLGALVEFGGELDDALLEGGDAALELFDVVVGAEPGLGPDLLAEQLGELAFELADPGILTRSAALGVGQVGLQLAEAKDLLAAVQDTLVSHQVRPLVMRTLFGRLRLDSPRWWHCGCQPQTNRTFSPLAAILPERTTPELSYLQARFAGLVAYGPSATLLAEALPRPDLPITASLDDGYVHSSQQRSRRDGWFEVITGRVTPANGPGKVLWVRPDLRSCWLIRLGVDRRAGVAPAC